VAHTRKGEGKTQQKATELVDLESNARVPKRKSGSAQTRGNRETNRRARHGKQKKPKGNLRKKKSSRTREKRTVIAAIRRSAMETRRQFERNARHRVGAEREKGPTSSWGVAPFPIGPKVRPRRRTKKWKFNSSHQKRKKKQPPVCKVKNPVAVGFVDSTDKGPKKKVKGTDSTAPFGSGDTRARETMLSKKNDRLTDREGVKTCEPNAKKATYGSTWGTHWRAGG